MDSRQTYEGASGKDGVLSNVVMRALEESGGILNIESFRAPGFRLLEKAAHDPRFRALAPLPERSQIVMDNAVVKVGMERLTVVRDFMAAGLTYKLDDPLSVTQLEWYSQNQTGNAQRTMTPEARGENFMPDRLPGRLPVYLTTATFQLGIRELRQSQRLGLPLDTAGIESGTRAVNELIEDAMINGATTIDGQELKVAGYAAPGLVNAPNAVTGNLSLADWSTTPNGAAILLAVENALALLRANKKYGPYAMWVSTNIGAKLGGDYSSAKGDNTIKDRLLKIEGLSSIKTADLLPDNKVIIMQMTSDVADLVIGQMPTVIPWTSASGFTFHNLIMAIVIPRIRFDYNNKSGIFVGTVV